VSPGAASALPWAVTPFVHPRIIAPCASGVRVSCLLCGASCGLYRGALGRRWCANGARACAGARSAFLGCAACAASGRHRRSVHEHGLRAHFWCGGEYRHQ
jgi:hypothetical protein